MDVTQAFAATFVDELATQGVRFACVSPGSRSAPLAMALMRHPRIRVFMQIDERCGSFFALGLGRATGHPAVILCTSGTAAAEFHPAVIEADQSGTPLIVLTADRPPELIGVGANQAIVQDNLYGAAVRWFSNPGPPTESPAAPRRWRRLAMRAVAEAATGPVHINLPFREPLVGPPGEVTSPLASPAQSLVHSIAGPTDEQLERLSLALRSAQRPVVIAGEMRDGDRLADELDRLGIPLLAEPSSQLRSAGASIVAYEALLRSGWASTRRPDLVVRLGGTPTSKMLNAWVVESGAEIVLVDPGRRWRDPDQVATVILDCDPLPLLQAAPRPACDDWRAGWEAAAVAAEARIRAQLATLPLFEGHIVAALAAAMPPRTNLFVGSSMPIRAVDAFWPRVGGAHRFFGNRGASGIDGLVSTGLGIAAAAAEPTVLLLGDLSLYHDMNGLWALRRHHLRATVVVCDNGGGGIFDFLPQAAHTDVFEELFATPLGLDLGDVARLYGLTHVEVDDPARLIETLRAAIGSDQSTMVVVRYRRADSVSGHRAIWAAV